MLLSQSRGKISLVFLVRSGPVLEDRVEELTNLIFVNCLQGQGIVELNSALANEGFKINVEDLRPKLPIECFLWVP